MPLHEPTLEFPEPEGVMRCFALWVAEVGAGRPMFISDMSVRRQMDACFGAGTRDWELLRTDCIPNAVPSQRELEEIPARLRKGLYVCGDHCGIASLNTALASGTAAAEAILEDLP